MEESIDVDILISEVKKHPVLWKTSLEDYHDRNLKQLAWMDISKATHPNMKEKELKAYSISIMKKWKNLKDNYTRYVKKQKQSGIPTKRKKYIYANEMSFLSSEIDIRAEGSPDDTGEVKVHNSYPEEASKNGVSETIIPSAGAESSISLPIPANRYNKSTRRQQRSIPKVAEKRKKLLEETLLDFIKTPETNIQPDGDQSFFDSLLPIVRHFNIDEKLEFRTEVMRVIQNIRKNKTSSTNSGNQDMNQFPEISSPPYNYRYSVNQNTNSHHRDNLASGHSSCSPILDPSAVTLGNSGSSENSTDNSNMEY